MPRKAIYQKNKEHYRKYNREFLKVWKEKNPEWEKEWNKKNRDPKRWTKYQIEYQRKPKNWNKYLARQNTYYHVRVGNLQKELCEIGTNCKGKVEAHHDDYNKRLDIKWFCKKHHEQYHTDEIHNGPPVGNQLGIVETASDAFNIKDK